jgi:hypothetical protein
MGTGLYNAKLTEIWKAEIWKNAIEEAEKGTLDMTSPTRKLTRNMSGR